MNTNIRNQINNIINLAIKEDKVNQDITSKLSLSNKLICKVYIKSKDQGILSGLPIVKQILKKDRKGSYQRWLDNVRSCYWSLSVYKLNSSNVLINDKWLANWRKI